MKPRILSTARLSLPLALALTLLAGVPTASASWLIPPGETSGDGYSAGNGYDYLATANWNGGTIDDNFSTLGLTGALTISLNNNRTTAAGGLNLTLTGASDFSLLSDNGTSRAITLGGNVTADVTDGSQTITIGATARPVTINLNNGTRIFTVGTGDTLVTNGVISSSTAANGKLTKDGSGVLTLNAASSYTGQTTVTAGELRYGIANAVNSGSTLVINSGGTLNVGNFTSTIGTTTLNKGGTLSGGTANLTTGTFTLADGGTVNGFNGTTAGFLNLGNNLSYTSSGASSVMATINRLGAGGATRTLTIARGGDSSGVDLDITEVLMGNGNFNLVKAGAGVLRLSGSTASSGRGTGTTTINDGTVLLNKSASVEAIGGTGTITIGDNTGTAGSAILQHATGSADNQILNNAVTLNSDGLWDLNGHNETTSGTLTINRNGQVDLNGSSLSVGALAIVATSGSGNTTPIKNTAGSGSLTMTTLGITPLAGTTSTISLNGATATLGGNVTFTAATTGQAQITGGTLALGGNRTFNVGVGSGTTYDLDINVPITGSGNTLQQVTSAGRLQFSGSGANTYNGLTTVSAGTLLLAKSGVNAIGGNLTVSGGTARLTGTGDDQIPNTANVVVSSGTFDLNDLNETVNGVQQTGGTIQGGAGILTSSTAYDMQAGTVSAILGGSAGLTKTTAGTVTLSGANAYTGPTAVTAGTLLVNSPGSLAAGSAVTVASGATLAGDGTVNGTVAVSGTVSGTGIFNGAVTVNSGGTLAGTITIGGVVTAAASGNISPAGSGATGTLNLTNAGNALTLNGSALFFDVLSNDGSSRDQMAITGNLVLNGPTTLFINAPAGIAAGNYTLMTFAATTGPGSIVFPNGSTTMGNLTVTVNATDVTLSVGVGGATGDVWSGAASYVWDDGALNWTKNGTASQAFADGDAVTFDDTGAAAATITSVGTVAPSSVLFNNSSKNYTVSATIGGTGTPVVKNGSGTVTLSTPTAANTYTGGTTVNAGTLQGTTASTSLTPPNPLSTGAVTLNGSGTILQLRASGTLNTTAETIQFNNNVTVGGNATIDINRPGVTSTTKTIQLGTLSIGATTLGVTGANTYALSFSGATTLTGNATFNPTTANLTLAGAVGDGSADYSLTKTGAGTLILTSANTFSGGVFINSGVLQLGSAAANLGDSANLVTFAGNGTLQFTSSTTLSQGFTINEGATGTFWCYKLTNTMTSPLAGSGTLNIQAQGDGYGGLFQFTNTNNTFSGDISIYNSSGGSYAAELRMDSLDDTPGRRIKLANTAAFTYGTNAVVPLVLSNRQIEHNAAGVGILNNNATNVNSTVTVNTDLLMTTNGNRNFTLGGSNTGNNTFAGAIGDKTGYVTSLTKANAGTWILSNTNNTFTGAITLNSTTTSAGTLSYASASPGGANPITFNQTTGTATLSYIGAAPRTMSGLITASALTTGTITLDASGATPTDTINYSNASSLTAVSTSTGTRNIVLAGSNTGNNIFNGVITNNSGTGGKATLTKNGNGTWVLTNSNTYTGATLVNAGTLLVNGSTHASSAVTVGASGTLGGSGTVNGTVSVTAGGTIQLGASGSTLTMANSTAPTYNSSGATYTTLKLLASAATLDKVSTSATTGNSVANVDLVIDTTGLTGNVASTIIYQAGGAIAGPFHSVTFSANPGGYTATLDYTTSGQISLALSGGSPYETWAGPGVAFDADANGDGVKNGLAFLLGAATPNTDATGLLPTTSQTGGNLVMTFTCLAAADRGTATLTLEYDGDLASTWLSVPVPGAVGAPNPIVETTATGSVSFVATDGGTNGNGDALIDVVATVSDATESAAGKLFGRLKAVNP